MPRLNRTPPKYRLHNSTHQAVCEFGGKRHYLGPYGSEKSYRRYRELLEEWRSQLHQQQPLEQQPDADEQFANSITDETLRARWKQGMRVSVNELIVVYTRFARSYYVKNGEVTREAELIEEILVLVSEKHGSDCVENFGPVDLDNFRDTLITDKDWSRKFINKHIARVIRMFKWAVKKEICSDTVYGKLAALGGLKKGRTEARESEGVSIVEDSIVEQTLEKLPPIVADMVRFQRLAGCRPGEVCSICPGDIDRSGEVWIYTPDSHKTEHHEKHRKVLVGPRAQKILLKYLLRPADSFCFSPVESIEAGRRRAAEMRKTPISCGNRRGTNRAAAPKRIPSDRYKVASYRVAIRRACNKVGVSVWTPNQLRHTAATMIRRDYGVEAAQVICGHEKADVTQVYAERDMLLGMKVAKEIG